MRLVEIFNRGEVIAKGLEFIGGRQLTELQGIDSIRPISKKRKASVRYNDLRAYLDSMGWQRLGKKGLRGTVYSLPNKEYVIKIFHNDRCYKTFVDYVLSNQNNPHLPKIIGKKLKFPGDRAVFGVRLERLDSLSANEYFGNRGLIAWLAQKMGYAYAQRALDDFDISPDKAIVLADNFQINNLKLTKVIFELHAIMPSSCAIDLHEDNFMKRGNTLVITDPLIYFRK